MKTWNKWIKQYRYKFSELLFNFIIKRRFIEKVKSFPRKDVATKGKRQHLRTKRWCCKFYAENAFHGEINFQTRKKKTIYRHTHKHRNGNGGRRCDPICWYRNRIKWNYLSFGACVTTTQLLKTLNLPYEKWNETKEPKLLTIKIVFMLNLKTFVLRFIYTNTGRRIFIRHFYYKWKMQSGKKNHQYTLSIFRSLLTHLLQCLQSGIIFNKYMLAKNQLSIFIHHFVCIACAHWLYTSNEQAGESKYRTNKNGSIEFQSSFALVSFPFQCRHCFHVNSMPFSILLTLYRTIQNTRCIVCPLHLVLIKRLSNVLSCKILMETFTFLQMLTIVLLNVNKFTGVHC